MKWHHLVSDPDWLSAYRKRRTLVNLHRLHLKIHNLAQILKHHNHLRSLQHNCHQYQCHQAVSHRSARNPVRNHRFHQANQRHMQLQTNRNCIRKRLHCMRQQDLRHSNNGGYASASRKR